MEWTAVVVIIVTLIAKLSGFARDMALSFYYGASNASDVFLISQIIPVSIFSLFGVAISTTYIPTYNLIDKEQGPIEAQKYTNKLLNTVLSISLLTMVVAWVGAPYFVESFSDQLTGDLFVEAVYFTRISLLSLFAIGFTFVLTPYLQNNGNFIVPAAMLIPLNLLNLLAIFLSHKLGFRTLLYGSLIAAYAQILFLAPFLVKKGYHYQGLVDFKDKHIKKIIFMAIPIIIGTSINQINILIDKTSASDYVVGGITAITYADKLTQFVQGLFVITIATVVYPSISKWVAHGNIEESKLVMVKGLLGIIFLVAPTTVFFMVFSGPIIQMMFGRGAFSSQAASMTAAVLFYYAIGLLAIGVREVVARVFYAMNDMRTPMINAAIGIMTNVALNYVLVSRLGISGLALATSLSAVVAMLLLLLQLRMRIGPLGLMKVFITTLKVAFASAVFGIVAKLVNQWLLVGMGNTIALVLCGLAGGLCYLFTIYVIGFGDVKDFINEVRK